MKESIKVERFCVDCGISLGVVNGNKKRCYDCAEKAYKQMKREAAKECNKAKRAKQKAQPKFCIDCGCDITGTILSKKRCTECAIKENRRQSAEWNKNHPRPKKKYSKQVKKTDCVECKGCKHYKRMSGIDGIDNYRACHYAITTDKLRNIPPELCYKHENTPYERVGR